MKPNENTQAVTCLPYGENVALATKRGLFNKETFFTTLLPACGVLPPQVEKLTTRGFTLIELLVVVLIIGILAAVAVPQYQVAVKKAQLMKYVPIVRALNEAEQVYFLAHGEYTANLFQLDVELPSQGCTYKQDTASGYYQCETDPITRYGVWGGVSNAQAGDSTIRYLQYFADYDTYHIKAGDVACYSRGDVSRRACRSLGSGSEQDASPTGWDYIYVMSN